MAKTKSWWRKLTSRSKKNALRKMHRARFALEELEDRRVLAAYGELPLSFEANHGQTDPSVDFLSRGSGYSLFLTRGTAVLSLSENSGTVPADDTEPSPTTTTVLRMSLEGANSAPPVEGQELQDGVSNYLIGSDPSQWHTSVPNYGRVAYHDVYPGVDLIYYGNQRQLEYDFTVEPGADPSGIRLRFEGADSESLDTDGNLILHTSAGDVVWHAPVLYQDVNGVRQSVSGNYVLDGPDRVRFHVGEYDLTQTLVIDPVLSYSTYLGGSGMESGRDIAVDSSGSVYVTGITGSTNFPVTAGARQTTYGGGALDAFVTKLNAAGTALIYSTYLGGSSDDTGNGIAVDSLGNAYVTGKTRSTNYPVTAGPLQTNGGGAFEDAFVTKLNAAGTALVYSTYLGGSYPDIGEAIAVDSSGNAYVTGDTRSTNFPVTAGARQTTYGGGNVDAFVAKLNGAGTALVYSTYLGGGSGDAGYGIAVDSSGNAYVTGDTRSTNFPVTAGARQTTWGGNYDAFVAKLNATGTALAYSTYLGGSSDDTGGAIAVDSSGSVYVTGITGSTNFPVTAGARQTTYGGGLSTLL